MTNSVLSPFGVIASNRPQWVARLEQLFKACGFKFYIRQNCATNEPHFNVVFSALSEREVMKLSKRFNA